MVRPSFQFYPGDWLHDTALRICSIGARGLWIDMICLMHQGNPYGYLKVNHKVIHEVNLAKITGLSLEEVKGYLFELEDAGVFSRDKNGVIFSRRMVSDEAIRQKRAECGKMGGNPELKITKVKHKVNQKVKQKTKNKVNQKTTPSSSSSSSSSSSNNKNNIYSQDAQKVLNHLNQKKGSNYTKKDEIIARLKEKHTIEECIIIIENKFKDPYFIENPNYLNPSTLFRKSHFDNYLNETPKKSTDEVFLELAG